MKPLDRRKFLALAAVPVVAQTAGARPLFVCMHEASSAGFDFRTAMEGYAKAGIRAVEVMLTKVREFAEKESPATARRLLQDLALRPVSCSNQVGLAEPNPARTKNLEELKWKCELAQAIGGDRLVAPSAARERFTEDDYKRGADNLREAGEVARPYNVTLMLEFTRMATFAGSLSTALKLVREASHPNVRLMMDTYTSGAASANSRTWSSFATGSCTICTSKTCRPSRPESCSSSGTASSPDRASRPWRASWAF